MTRQLGRGKDNSNEMSPRRWSAPLYLCGSHGGLWRRSGRKLLSIPACPDTAEAGLIAFINEGATRHSISGRDFHPVLGYCPRSFTYAIEVCAFSVFASSILNGFSSSPESGDESMWHALALLHSAYLSSLLWRNTPGRRSYVSMFRIRCSRAGGSSCAWRRSRSRPLRIALRWSLPSHALRGERG